MRLAITDFGLAQSIEKSRTAPSTRGIEGTPAYLAPEQLTGGAITPATDVYALGVVLFEMLTGELPFERSDSWQQALDIRQRPPRVRSRQRKVSAVWDAAIAACMQQDARRRPERVTKVLRQVTGGLLTRRQAVAAGVATSVFVAGGLEARYLFRDPAIPAEALQAFKRGETFAQRRTEEGLKNSVEEFQQAVRFYPRYANAWVGLADAYSALANYGYMAPRDALGRAREAAAQALAIDDRFAQAQGIYGRILSLDVSQWLKAEPFLRRAVSLEPTNASLRLWYGAYLGKLRRRREAMEQIRAGLDQAPSSMPLNHQLATELFWERRFSEFLRQAEALARLQPYEAGSHLVRARALEWAGRYDDALSACDEADRLKPTQTGSCYRASALAARGDTGGAFRIVGRVREYWNRNPFESALLAGLYAQLGDVPQAMEVVAEGYRRYDSTVLTIPCTPYFDKYRGAAQYRDFLKRIGGPADREITGG
jgi:serine/threonine protein kinase